MTADATAVIIATLAAAETSRSQTEPRGLLLACGVTAAGWQVVAAGAGCYRSAVLDAGGEQFRRLLNAAAWCLALAGLFGWIWAGQPRARDLLLPVLLAVPLVGLVRLGARAGLLAKRRRGQCRSRILVVGRPEDVAHVVQRVGEAPDTGLDIVGACTPRGSGQLSPCAAVPLAGQMEVSARAASLLHADAIAVAGPALGREGLRQLCWELEGSPTRLLLLPGLTDVAEDRLSLQTVAGLSSLEVRNPRFTGSGHVFKSVIDRLLACAVLVLLVPVLLLVAAAIAVTSPGPVLFRQVRIGRHGRPFTCLKFRSMHVDAPERLRDLAAVDEGNGVLFKVRRDPRVTPVGRWLRRFSLDELPQLVNVVLGSMSLVGPRPPLPHEVDRYTPDARRRLLVRPGLTGLWQVSGRSDLSWDESLRLDLYYVQNWSLVLDLRVIARTLNAVASGRGAY